MKKILRWRIWILVIVAGLSVFFAFNVRSLKTNAGIGSILPENNPDFIFAKKMEKKFGGIDQLILSFAFKDKVLRAEHLELIKMVGDWLTALPEIRKENVKSLMTLKDIRGGNGGLLITPLIDSVRMTNTDYLKERSVALSNDSLLYGRLISRDMKSTLIVVQLGSKVSLSKRLLPLVQKIEDYAKALKLRYPKVRLTVSGMPVIKAHIMHYMKRDMAILFPLALIVVFFLIMFLLRSPLGTLLPMTVTVLSIVFTLGLKALLHSPVTIIEIMIPVILISIGCADGVHIVSEYADKRREGLAHDEAIIQTMRELRAPIVMTSLTTAVGFASLIFSPEIAMKNLGIYLSFGVMVAMFASLVVLPAMLSFFKNLHVRQNKTEVFFQKTANGIGKLVTRHKKAVIVTFAAIALLSVWSMFHLNVESDEVQHFKNNDPLKIAIREVERDFGGIVSLDVILSGEEPDIMKEPEILQFALDFQKFAEKQPLVSYAFSIADYVKRINKALHDNNPDFERLPAEKEIVGKNVVDGKLQVSQLLVLYEWGGGDALNKLVDEHYKTMRIVLRLNNTASRKLAELIPVLNQYLQKHCPKKVHFRFANQYTRYVNQNLIVRGQVRSLSIVVVVIFLLLSLNFRSFRGGLVTVFPVFIGVLSIFLIMWIFNVSLNIGTAILASVAMGVGVDYAIYIYTYFKRNVGAEAVLRTLQLTTKGIVINALSVGTGFVVLMFSKFHTISDMGLLMSGLNYITAIVALLLLPAILSFEKRNKLDNDSGLEKISGGKR